MENPFAPKYDPCNPCTDGTYDVEKCYSGDPRWIAVTVPYAAQPLIFAKGTVRTDCKTDACADACPPLPIPQSYSKAVLTGEAIYAGEWGTDAKLRYQTIELIPENTTIAGVSYTDFDTFCAALTDLIADCDCNCD